MPQVAQLHRSEKKPAQLAAIQAGRPGSGGLAQLAQDLNATQRNRDLSELAQRMPVQQVTDTIDAAHASEARWKAGRAVQRAPSQLKPLRSTLMSGAARAPMQFAFWDYLKAGNISTSLLLGGATAALAATGIGIPLALGLGAVTGAATYAGGVGAGLGTAALGGAGALAGGALAASTVLPALVAPAVGALAGGATGLVHGKTGGVLGAAAGALAPGAALAALGSGFGATIGADVQSAASTHPIGAPGVDSPTAGEAIYARAREIAVRAHGAGATTDQIVAAIDAAGLRALVSNDATLHDGTAVEQRQRLPNIIRHHAQGLAGPGAANAVNTAPVRAAVSATLLANPFIQGLLAGTNPGNNSVQFAGGHGSADAQSARQTFNTIVNRPGLALPNVTAEESWTDPISYMGDDGTMSGGWGTTRGNLVHELGHHLENNVPPTEFGTLHNFLMARSAGWQMRNAGTGPAHNQRNTGLGYDTNTVNPVAPQSMPLTRLGANLMTHHLGIRSGEQGIDRFVQSQSHRDDSSYATKVYQGGAQTEFTATTIHLLTQRNTATALINADPLRVCLFLYLANRPAYDQVAAALALLGPPTGPLVLDQLIHRVS